MLRPGGVLYAMFFVMFYCILTCCSEYVPTDYIDWRSLVVFRDSCFSRAQLSIDFP